MALSSIVSMRSLSPGQLQAQFLLSDYLKSPRTLSITMSKVATFRYIYGLRPHCNDMLVSRQLRGFSSQSFELGKPTGTSDTLKCSASSVALSIDLASNGDGLKSSRLAETMKTVTEGVRVGITFLVGMRREDSSEEGTSGPQSGGGDPLSAVSASQIVAAGACPDAPDCADAEQLERRDQSSPKRRFWDVPWLLEQDEGPLLHQSSLCLALLSASAARGHMTPAFSELRANPTFMSAAIAWFLAQVLKVFTTYAFERRWDPKLLMGSGGMPSSHSALCLALTTSVALTHGFTGPLFPVCLGFSLIVMYDATGVRYHAGMMAEVLNVIVQDLFQGHPVSQKKLKELIGHTPLQVGAGALLGSLVAFIYSKSSWAVV